MSRQKGTKYGDSVIVKFSVEAVEGLCVVLFPQAGYYRV
jgi:hypothetical protein